MGFVFIPSHPCQKLVDGSCDAGGFGDVWFNGRVREDGNTIPGINFHRNIHLLTAALTGSFLGERRLMWNALQVLTQRRCASKLSSIPEMEGPHLFFALTPGAWEQAAVIPACPNWAGHREGARRDLG